MNGPVLLPFLPLNRRLDDDNRWLNFKEFQAADNCAALFAQMFREFLDSPP